jgi:D-inositol-3-phosphate glycosyltransferase
MGAETMTDKRIAMISEHASPLSTLGGKDSGGQNVYVAKIASGLAKYGFLVDVFTRRETESLPEIVEFAPGVRVIQVTAGPAQVIEKEKLLPFMDEFSLEMLRFIKHNQLRYDLIHAHFFMSAWVAYQLKRWLSLPYVVTFHALGKIRRLQQGTSDRFPDERMGIEAVVVTDADLIIAECPQEVSDLMEMYGADRQRLRVVPCGFDPSELHPLPKRLACMKLGLDPHKRYILHLGRMVQRKGIETVIRGFAHLLATEQLEDVELLIVGGETEDADPEKTVEIGRLRLVAESLAIDHKIHFLGKRSREWLRYLYNAAELFVTVPWYEPFGITPLEAMACAKPVVGSRVGGIQFSVVDEQTGILVPPKNPLAVAKAFYRMLQHPAWARELGKNGRQRVQKFFTWEIVVKDLIRVYEQVWWEHRPLSHQEPLLAESQRELLFATMTKGGRVVRVQEDQPRQPPSLWRKLWQSVTRKGEV